MAVLDSKGFVQHFGDWCKTVGGTACVTDDFFTGVILVVVYPIHVHGNTILPRCSNQDLLRTGIDMERCAFFRDKNPGRLDDQVNVPLFPRKLRWVSVGDTFNGFAVTRNRIFTCGHFMGKFAEKGIILK